MNRILFELQKGFNKRIFFIGVLILFAVLGIRIFFALYNANNSFIKYASVTARVYKTNSFYKITDSLLRIALLDTSEQDTNDLNAKYPRLIFDWPKDPNYTPTGNDVRLVGYKPRNQADSEFYYNSDFKKFLDMQIRHPNIKYFEIQLGKSRKNNHIITSLRIAHYLSDLALENDPCTNIIGFNDPYKSLDGNVMYLGYGNKFIPLFITDSANNNNSFSIGDIEKCNMEDVSQYYTQKNPLKVKYKDGQFTLYYNNERELKIKSESRKYFARVYPQNGIISNKDNVIIANVKDHDTYKIELVNRTDSSLLSFTICKKSPFENASTLAKGALYNTRITIDTTYCDLFSKQLLKVTASNLRKNSKMPARIVYSINPILSKYLEDKIKMSVSQFELSKGLTVNSSDIFEMSVCLLDASTGEVIAAPYFSNVISNPYTDEINYQRNFNFEYHVIGSTFKPLIAFTSALRFPALKNFVLEDLHTHENSGRYSLLGYSVRPYGEGEPLFWGKTPCTRRKFLAISHDNYPIALALLSLAEESDKSFKILSNANGNSTWNRIAEINRDGCSHISNSSDGVFHHFKGLDSSSYFNLFSDLFDVDLREPDNRRDNSIAEGFEVPDDLAVLFPDKVSLYLNRIAKDGGPFPDFKTFILGQGDNKWTNIKLAEAYARILTGKKVVAHILANISGRSFDDLYKSLQGVEKAQFDGVRNDFMEDWRNADADKSYVAEGSTVYSEYDLFKKALPPHLENVLRFYAKTGTPANLQVGSGQYLDTALRTIDEGLFAFGIMDERQTTPHGIIGVVNIKHIVKGGMTKDGIASKHAKEFFTTDVFREIIKHTKGRL